LELAERSADGGARLPKVVKVSHYLLGEGNCMKVGEFEDALGLEALKLPQRAGPLAITLPDGKEKVFSGALDRELVASYRTILQVA